MIRNFIYIKDNFLSEKECDQVISYFNKLPSKSSERGNYDGVFIDDEKSPHLKSKELLFLKGRFQQTINDYASVYPELNFLDDFFLKEIRFKHWKADKFFDNWHSEQDSINPYRVLNFMIYLSTHDCGTQFFDGSVIKSEKGRLTIFPSYFTHTHRGMPCPEKKDRYMFGGYFNFFKKVLCQ
jgi:hypothetical protein